MTTIVDLTSTIQNETEEIRLDIDRLAKYAKLLRDVGLDKIATDILDATASINSANMKISGVFGKYLVDSFNSQIKISDEHWTTIIEMAKHLKG